MRRVPLKTRVLILAITIVTAGIILQAALQVDSLIAAWLDSSLRLADLAGQQTKEFLLVRLEEKARQPRPVALNWAEMARYDERLAQLVEATMAQVPAVAEISIAGPDGGIVVSSNRSIYDSPLRSRESLRGLAAMSSWTRAQRLFSRGRDYEVRIALGMGDDPTPVFTIQVLVSTALLRHAIEPGLRATVAGSAAMLAGSIVVIYLLTSLGARHAKRISELVDRVARGEVPASDTAGTRLDGDFAAVESKLNLLGHQFRGALDDAEELRESVAKIVERLEEAIFIFGPGEKLVFCGGAAGKLVGIDSGGCIGQSLERVFPAAEPLGGLLRNAFDKLESVSAAPLTKLNPNGSSELLVTVDFLAERGAGDRTGALVRIRDRAGARKLEDRMNLLSRFERISLLTGGVAHEIKNPLNSIVARLDLLESMLDPKDGESSQEVQAIAREVERLDRVVRTFLDFNKPVKPAMEEVRLHELVREVAELVRPSAQRSGVIVRLDSVAETTVQGDADLLKQALLNIVVNGIEAMPGGGVLLLEVAGHGGQARLTVADNGPGIAEADREKIFQLYYTTKRSGSGMGLATAYRTVQLHGGSMSVESQPGQGARFLITLPLAADGSRP